MGQEPDHPPTTADIVARFRDAMRAAGVEYSGEIVADGELHAVKADDDRPGERSLRYLLHADGVPNGWFQHWRDHPEHITWKWTGPLPSLTPAEARRRDQEARRRQAERDAEEALQRREVAQAAARRWDAAGTADPDHPYLRGKGIAPHGTRQDGDDLLIPIIDTDGTLHALQTVRGNGAKRFQKSAPLVGHFAEIGEWRGAPRVYLAEGFGTAATVAEATGAPTVCAFFAANLIHVARALRAASPESEIIVVGDDDRWKPDQGTRSAAHAAAAALGGLSAFPLALTAALSLREALPPEFDLVPNPHWHSQNTGRAAAEAAAQAVAGRAIFPVFLPRHHPPLALVPPKGQRPVRANGPTDFNDLATLAGLDEVRRQIDRALSEPPANPVAEVIDLDSRRTAPPSLNPESAQDAATVRQAIERIRTEDKPGAAYELETSQALARLAATDPPAYADLRYQLKRAHPGVRIGDVDRLQKDASNALGLTPEQAPEPSLADQLVDLVRNEGEVFVDQEGDPHITLHALPRKTFLAQSKACREWLSFLAFDRLGHAASDTLIGTVVATLAGAARHGGEDGKPIEHPVYLRAAPDPQVEGYFIDLANDRWQAVHVTTEGWHVIDNPPVRFRRSQSMRELPMPARKGRLDALWNLVNISPQDRPMVAAWMLEAWRPDTPFPMLELIGGQGSAKSHTATCLRNLIDPSAVNLRAAPKDVESVFVSANSNWMACYNNLSKLSPTMQDAFCTLATGGGFAARALYTNKDEAVIESKRPVLVNGITPLFTAQDAVDRCIRIQLAPIRTRRKESELNAAFATARASIFGALLDLFTRALSILPTIQLDSHPRMADFAELGAAVYQALGCERAFADDYRLRQLEAITTGVEASPAAAAILELADTRPDGYTGTVKGLLGVLNDHFKREGESWPRSPRGLSDILRRQATALESIGVRVLLDPVRHSDGYRITVRKFSALKDPLTASRSRSSQVHARSEHAELPEHSETI